MNWEKGIPFMREVVSIMETFTVEVEGGMLRGGGGFVVGDIFFEGELIGVR